MKYIAEVNALGRVISVFGTSDASTLVYGPNDIEVPEPVGELLANDPSAFYVSSNQEFILKPPQPSASHTFNYITKQWEPDPVLAAQLALTERAQRLQSSDWTQLPDVPLATKEAWAVYRQALRDITEQPGYPLDVVWPSPPA